LSSNDPPSVGSLRGLLFVPRLHSSDPCNDVDAILVPKNATRSADLPEKEQDIIALAPWPSQSCAKAYLDATLKASPTALIFYNPDSKDNHSAPLASSANWNLQGGLGWEDGMKFPVYAIPGALGSRLMNELALYPGSADAKLSDGQANSTSEPWSCTHLYAMVDLGRSSSTHSFYLTVLTEIQRPQPQFSPILGWLFLQ
jgi:hypothetical protein